MHCINLQFKIWIKYKNIDKLSMIDKKLELYHQHGVVNTTFRSIFIIEK